jgi:hypothetical protein
MTAHLKRLLPLRSTDSDVRCALLLAAVRAFREVESSEDARREDQLLAEFAEPVVVPDLEDR